MSEQLVTIEGLIKRFATEGAAALDHITATIRSGQVTGLVGPDGAGKTTLMRLMAGLLAPSEGKLTVLGFDTVTEATALREEIGYMPQRFGLYEDLSVLENLALYADLRGVVGQARKDTFEKLLAFTDLARFTERRAGALSGGMKQKLGLACAMLRSPRLLLLDEPSVGVDPISRRELWRMVYTLIEQGVGVVWSTAYLDEAENCAEVMVLNLGKMLYEGNPKAMTASVAGRVFQVRGAGERRRELLAQALMQPEVIDGVMQGEAIRLVVAEGTKPPPPSALSSSADLAVNEVRPRFEDAFVTLLGGQPKRTLNVQTPTRPTQDGSPPVEAKGLTRRFGSFTAADHITFAIERGEIFGLLGPNGAGKSTTFKMMCGLLRPSEGTARVDGLDLYRAPADARGRLGYMAQKFSLYGDLSVRQNLDFFAGAYGLAGKRRREAIERVASSFDLARQFAVNAGELPLGFKQRLALACAVMHDPPVLFLDEPTSGVDPLTRREFWGFINAVVAKGVTIMVTTHFMDEAEYCDRVALIYRGKMIAMDTPEALQYRVKSDALPNPTLEDAFIGLIESHDLKEAA
jgi:ABC-2 type transport system ATP-binding protein